MYPKIVNRTLIPTHAKKRQNQVTGKKGGKEEETYRSRRRSLVRGRHPRAGERSRGSINRGKELAVWVLIFERFRAMR